MIDDDGEGGRELIILVFDDIGQQRSEELRVKKLKQRSGILRRENGRSKIRTGKRNSAAPHKLRCRFICG